MKSFVITFCVVIVGVLARLPSSEKKFLVNVHDSCQAEPATYVDDYYLRNLGVSIDNVELGKHIFCMTKKIGLQKPNGELDLAVITEKIDLVTPDKSKVKGLVETCSFANDESPEKTATLLWLCFHDNNIPYNPRA